MAGSICQPYLNRHRQHCHVVVRALGVVELTNEGKIRGTEHDVSRRFSQGGDDAKDVLEQQAEGAAIPPVLVGAARRVWQILPATSLTRI